MSFDLTVQSNVEYVATIISKLNDIVYCTGVFYKSFPDDSEDSMAEKSLIYSDYFLSFSNFPL